MTRRDYYRRKLSRALREAIRDGQLSEQSLLRIFGVTKKYLRMLKKQETPR